MSVKKGKPSRTVENSTPYIPRLLRPTGEKITFFSEIKMSDKPILYYIIASPPCRSVLLCAAELGIDLELREVNVLGGDTHKDDFLEMNVQHTIPTLDDNGTIIVDSHVICGYLVDKFGDSDRLYPKDVASRALVDARMFFDAGVFAKIRMITDYVFFAGITEIPEEKVEFAQRSWTTLNRMVEKTPYVCGDDMTIADLCLVASVSSMTQIAPLDLERHAAVLEWIHRMEQLPYYEEANGNGAKAIQDFVFSKLEQNAGEE